MFILLLPDDDGLPLAGIIGIVIGGLLLVALACLLMVYCILSHIASFSLILLLPDDVGLPLAGIIGIVTGGLLLVACLLVIYCILSHVAYVF